MCYHANFPFGRLPFDSQILGVTAKPFSILPIFSHLFSREKRFLKLDLRCQKVNFVICYHIAKINNITTKSKQILWFGKLNLNSKPF